MSLFSSLSASSGALAAFQRALEVTQNNVNNASTPGYARQTLSLQASPFQPAQGLAGGVTAGELQSTRNRYADAEVLRKQESAAYFDQKTISLSSIETSFNISDTGSIASALNTLFQAFSGWSAAPNDTAARQSVLEGATQVVHAFQDASAGLAGQLEDSTRQLRDGVKNINDLTGQLREYNSQRLRSPSPDPSLEAKTQSTLEQLSQVADITTLPQPDGTVTVLLGGQTPLVVGDRQYDLSLSVVGNAPAAVLDPGGADITGQISQGKMAALLDVRNRILPSFLGDANQPGDLNRMAAAVADRVNQLLTAGQTADGQPGAPLFTYDSTTANGSARTLVVNPRLTGAQLGAIDSGPPASANGVALKLADLSSSSNSADQIDGYTFIQFYGSMAARAGSALADARDARDTQKQLLTQAQSLRTQASGVSLDEEAVHLIEFQRAYQAAAKMISVLSELTQTAVDLVR